MKTVKWRIEFFLTAACESNNRSLYLVHKCEYYLGIALFLVPKRLKPRNFDC